VVIRISQLRSYLDELTIEEKAALLEGTNSWYTNAIPRLGIPALMLTDGPHGVRKVRQTAGGFGISDNEHSTAFPTSAAVASSWNPQLAYRMGQAIAEECRAAGVDVLLAPGINIKRSPLCGRNFEYYSEDPLISGTFGAAFVRGVQSKGVGCCVKHYAANSNEDHRFVGDSVVDERALREIYLRAFEQVIKEAQPYAVMSAYNRVNGIFASQNRQLLTDILRHEWGFQGLVMTDWGATCDRVEGLKAGCDLDMPGGVWHNRSSIIEAAKNGTLPMEILDQSVARVLNLIHRCKDAQIESDCNHEEHARLACEIAKESAVLLKNDGTLPLSGDEKLLVVGEMFEKLRFQGAGSSLINPPSVISPRQAFDKRGVPYRYEPGYRYLKPEPDPQLEQAALAAAEQAEIILFFGGLDDLEESEGFDREHMRLGEPQIQLIQRLIAKGRKVVLVLFAGAPVELPFLDGLAALLNMYLPGMYGGEACASLLFGESTPSGKLAESWPLHLEDTSCFADYNRGPVSRYYESIYVGYRYYDKAGTPLRFPFGYGLSYTSFSYSNIRISESDGRFTICADITNVGERAGAEVVQLYVRHRGSQVFKADKELRAFAKVPLAPGETRTVTLTFARQDLAYWHPQLHRWVLENGTYEFCLAASAADIRLKAEWNITDAEDVASPYSPAVLRDYTLPPQGIPASFAELIGRDVPDAHRHEPLTLDSALREFRRTFMGRMLYRAIMRMSSEGYRRALKMPDSLERDMKLKNSYFLIRLLPNNSIRSMCMSSGGQFTYRQAVGFVELANGRIWRAMKAFLGKERPLPLPAGQQLPSEPRGGTPYEV